MRRPLALFAALAALLCCAALATGQGKVVPTFQKDPKGDAPKAGLDIVRVAMARSSDGKLRAELTMSTAWDADALRSDDGGPGTVCVRLFTRNDPASDPPDHLVCATPPAEGNALRGTVLRDRVNGLAKKVGRATVTRPTSRTIYLRFAQSAIGRPASLRFSGETVLHGSGCAEPVGCRDTAPDAPGSVALPLRAGR